VSHPPLPTLTERRIGTSAHSTYRIPDWEDAFGLVAGIATGGVGVDFSLDAPQPAGSTLECWHALKDELGGFQGVVFSRQVHESRVALHSAPVDGVLVQYGFDGHLTAAPGLLLAVTVADCVPVYLAEPGRRAWGILHAGWRGIAAGVIEAGITQLRTLAQCQAADIAIHCGVSVCGSCYEVGSEVLQAVLRRDVSGPASLDLRGAIVERARGLGVRQVSTTGWCTVHGGNRFQSYRRTGKGAGRMAAFIGMPA